MALSLSMERAAQWLETILFRPSRAIAGVGMSFVVVMMVLTALDTILRNFFNHPLAGAHELSEFLMVILVFLAVAYTAIEKGHIAVDFLSERLPKKIQEVLDRITNCLSLFISALITWQTIIFGVDIWKNRTISPVLDIPIFPFIFIVALGTGLLSLVLLVDFLHSWKGEK